MMQEEISGRVVVVMKETGKLTTDALKTALRKILLEPNRKIGQQREHEKQVRADAELREKIYEKQKEAAPHGKMSVQELIRQNKGEKRFEITKQDLKKFEKIAASYGVDYAYDPPKKGENCGSIYYKAADDDSITAIQAKMTQKTIKNYAPLGHENAENSTKEKTVREITKDKALEQIPVTPETIGDFTPIAKKYGISYTPYRVKNQPEYLVFFEAKNNDALEKAFSEYTGVPPEREKKATKEKQKTPLRERLRQSRQKLAAVRRTREQQTRDKSPKKHKSPPEKEK